MHPPPAASPPAPNPILTPNSGRRQRAPRAILPPVGTEQPIRAHAEDAPALVTTSAVSPAASHLRDHGPALDDGEDALRDEIDRLRGEVLRLERLNQRQETRIASILDITTALRARRSEDELLNFIMDKISVLMDADRSTLFLKEERLPELWTKVTQGRRTIEIRVAVGEGLAGWVAQTGQSLNVKDAYKDPRFNPDADLRTGYRTKSILCQPMRNQDRRIIGVIQVLNKRRGYFTVDDESLLSAIAAQAAIVIENSLLYAASLEANYELNSAREALEHKVSEQDLLFDIQRSVSQALNLDQLAEAVARKTLQQVPSTACVLTLRDGSSYQVHALKNNRMEKLGAHNLRAAGDEGPSGLVIERGVPYLCNDERMCMPDVYLKPLKLPVRSVVAVPLFSADEVFGSLELINKKGVGENGGTAEFSDADLKFLTLLSAQVAPAIATMLFRAQKEKDDRLASIGQMLSSVLHDFKTPVTIISGYVQLMAKEEINPDQRRDYANAIKRQFEALTTMTQEVLAFARGESTILIRKVFVARFMEEVTEMLEQELRDHDVALTVTTEYRRTAKFDEGKLKRVIFNLARNAMQAMPGGGTFAVSVCAEGDELVFRFADSGPGIPEDIRHRLFESFVTHGKREGTGLGLAIVKKIVEEHRGRIDFESRPGEGTTFEIRLPLETE
jgi:signal transduction histidine kinase/putative methionine-R-sulfoxide reductase with GAF domain